jgi:hypothetical protein
MMTDYVKITLLALAVSILFGGGYWAGYSKYVEYKKEVQLAAKEQEAKVESIQQQHELVKKGIQDEYDAKLSLLRQYYSNGVRQPDSGKLSGLSSTASITNATTTYNQLAQSCSMTTLQLVELQKFILESYSIK